MARPLQVNEFEHAVNAILADYKDTINADVQAITKSVAKDTVKKVQAAAPVRTGAYKKSIKSKVTEKGVNRATSVVYAAAPRYRLTHLLEYGHAKVNGGRVQARPHWSQAEQDAISEFERKLKEAIE